MEKEREYESLTETFEKIVLIIYPTLIFPRVLGTFSLGRWEKDERIGGAIKRFFSILFFFFLFRAEKFRCFAKCDYTG